MKQQINWKRFECDSVNGYAIQVTYTYSSFNQSEIDKIQNWCEEVIGNALVVHIGREENEVTRS